jgi:hypothetical protein
MAKDGNSKKPEDDSDITTNLLRQMGLGEDEIKSALDLAEKIQKKVETPKQPEPEPVALNFNQLSKEKLINIVETQNTQLNHFQNVVAIQFILLLKKYKDKVISLEKKFNSLENKLLEKNAEIEKLTKRLEYLLK